MSYKIHKFKCVICRRFVNQFGNNPLPILSSGKCCDVCNEHIVVPFRIKFNQVVADIQKEAIEGATA